MTIKTFFYKVKRKWMKLRLQPIRIFCLHHVCKEYDGETMYACDWMDISAFQTKINDLRNKGRIDNSQHSAISSDIENLRKVFNGYMHNTESYPSSESLKNFFKCHRIFIQECLK